MSDFRFQYLYLFHKWVIFLDTFFLELQTLNLFFQKGPGHFGRRTVLVLDLFIERKYLMVLFNDFFLQFKVFFLKLVDEIEVRLFLNVGSDHLLLQTF